MQEIVSLDEDDLANINHCISYLQLEARSDENETPQEVKRIFGAGYDIIRVCEKNCVGDARHCVVELKTILPTSTNACLIYSRRHGSMKTK